MNKYYSDVHGWTKPRIFFSVDKWSIVFARCLVSGRTISEAWRELLRWDRLAHLNLPKKYAAIDALLHDKGEGRG